MFLFTRERREAELCEAYRNAATPEEAALVLQRYALRFTISDATLESLKLPRSTSKPKEDTNQMDKENKLSSPINDTEISDHLHTTAVITEQKHTKCEDTEREITEITEQKKSASVSSSSSTPKCPLSTVTNSQNVPPLSLQLNEAQTQPTESLTAHQKKHTIENAQPQTKHTEPQTARVQPQNPTQPAYTLPFSPSAPSRPVPLLVAKPYCQPRSNQTGHKPVKVRAPYQLLLPVSIIW